MNQNIPSISMLLQELACYFGNRGFDGECCEDLTLIEFMALKMAFANSCFSIQDIGQALDLTKSGASRIIDRLENKGYVTRERSPADGRVCCVPVTTKGTELLSRAENKNISELNAMLKDFEPEMIDQIEKTLCILVNAVQQSKACCSPDRN